jgi:hypothetical protein
MAADKLIVDFVMKNARFRVKDQVHLQLSKLRHFPFVFESCFLTTTFHFIDEVINQFLNQNALELIQEMRQTASQSIAKVLKRLLDQTLQQVPMRLWLTD